MVNIFITVDDDDFDDSANSDPWQEEIAVGLDELNNEESNDSADDSDDDSSEDSDDTSNE